MTERSKPITVYAAMAANAAIAAAKFVAALFTGSSAMFAEGVHSLVDTSNEILLLVGIRASQKQADARHPFGRGKELYFYGLMVAMMLFAVGGGLSVYKGVESFLHPEPVTDPLWNYIVLAVAFLAEGSSWLIARRALRRRFPGEPLFRAMRKSKDPAVFMVAGEDTTALAGLVAALIGLLLTHHTGDARFDAAASAVIGLLLAAMALFLASESRKLLVGEGGDPEVVASVRRIAAEDEDVVKIWRALTMHFGPRQVLLAMDVEFSPDLTADRLVDAVDRLESRIKAAHPEINRIFIEAEALRR